MDFLKSQKRFNFKLGGKLLSELNFRVSEIEEINTLKTIYEFENGLKITNIATKYDEGYEWVNWLENTSNSATEVISELWDASVTLPFPHEEPVKNTTFQPEFNEIATLYAPDGCNWKFTDFACFPDRKANNRFEGHIPVGESKTFAPYGGRSSDGKAPFFNLHKDGKGYIFAVGWTGQWNFCIEHNSDDIKIKSGIEDVGFKLLPKEKFRTSSIVIMPYECSVADSQNKWRRFVKKYFSLMGKEGREKYGPLCSAVWGGLKTSSVLERIEKIKEYELPFEYIWMDAGWCGGSTKPTPDEFEGDWWAYTGDWRISPLIHPNGLKDVAKEIHDAGMKFLLWFEPERVRKTTSIVAEHPEYFLTNPNYYTPDDYILNLGDENAWNTCFETLSDIIGEIGIDCYRQDFNIDPIMFWRRNDTEDRKGITEIKHINGLYRLWDGLLEKFPHLLIDNCASGGRRIDIETLRRSIPMWRSDYQCPANWHIAGTQCHNLSYNTWMPYSGTSVGRSYFDTYRVRSAYGPSLNSNFTYSEKEKFGDDPKKMQWLKKMLEEYKKVRPFMSEDFYALTQISDRTDTWCAAQFDSPEMQSGMVQVFRREDSPFESAVFSLHNIKADCNYIFSDCDNDEEFVLSGKELIEKGFYVKISEKRTAKIYSYIIENK